MSVAKNLTAEKLLERVQELNAPTASRLRPLTESLSAEKLLERVKEVNEPTVARLRRSSTAEVRPTSPLRTNGDSPRRRTPTRTLSGQTPRGGPRRPPAVPSSDSSDQVDLLEPSDDEEEEDEEEDEQQAAAPPRRPQRTRSADTSTPVYQRPRGADRPRRPSADGSEEKQSARRRIPRSKSAESNPRGPQRVHRAGRRRPEREADEEFDDDIDEEDDSVEVEVEVEVDEDDEEGKEEPAVQPRRVRPNRTRSTPSSNPRRTRNSAQYLQSRQIAQMTRTEHDEPKSGLLVQRSKSMDLTAPVTEGRTIRGDRRAMREERMQARLEKQRQQLKQQLLQQEPAPEIQKPEPAWKRRLKKKSMDDSLNFDDVLDGSNQEGSARFSASMPTVPGSHQRRGFENSFTSDELTNSSPGFADFDDTNASSSFDGSYNEPMQDPMSSSMPGRMRRKSRTTLKKLDAFHASIPREAVLEGSTEDFDDF